MRQRHQSSGPIVLALAATLAAMSFLDCAIVLDASTDLGDVCTFESFAEICGICIELDCQPLVDACCGSAECSEHLDALDDCAEGDEEACLLLVAQPLTTELGLCVATSCPEDCLPDTVGAGAAGAGGGTGGAGLVAVCASNDIQCNCVVQPDEGQMSASCSSSSFDGGVCCAQPGYPALDLGCGCVVVECIGDDFWCECGYFSGDSAESFCPGFDYEVCCLDPTVPNCECGDIFCESHEELVSSCSAYDVGCQSGSEERYDCDL